MNISFTHIMHAFAFVTLMLHYVMHIDSANEGPTQKQSRTQWPEDEPVHPVPEDGVSLIKPSLFQGVAWGKASQPDKLTVA